MRPSQLVTLVLLLVLCTHSMLISGRLHCFRRVRRKPGLCGGLIRHARFLDAQHCCSVRGQGFAHHKVRVGKNRFRCSPCTSSVNEHTIELSSFVPTSPSPVSQAGRRRRTPKPLPPTATTTTSSPSRSSSTTEYVTWPAPRTRDHVMHRYRRPGDGSDVIMWQEWSPCSVTCGAGWRTRARICDACDHNDYENVRVELCMDKFYCPVDGNWGPWRAWSTCSTTCDAGVRTRSRKCNYPPPAYGGASCPGDRVQEKECHLSDCPVDGMWGAWSELSACSRTCGPGRAVKTRRCDSPRPMSGGKECPGPDTHTQRCLLVKCPVDGSWSRWSVWADCSVTCGRGHKEQTRTCTNPAPRHGGRDCEGDSRLLQDCHVDRPCPVDGGWSRWSKYSKCRAQPCSKGFTVRSRRCAAPRPAFGGRRCRGKRYDRKECFNDNGCPKNGEWCLWSEWNSCSSSCGEKTSVRGRQRHCACPASEGGGAECVGDSLQIEECKDIPPCSAPADETEEAYQGKSDQEHTTQANTVSASTSSASTSADESEQSPAPLRGAIITRVRYRVPLPVRDIQETATSHQKDTRSRRLS